MININDMVKAELSVLESGKWGTVGPHYTSASKLFAEYTGAAYGMLTSTFDAAYESVLRQCASRFDETVSGDVVITGEVSTPANSLIALCAGAGVKFAPVCERCGMISPKKLAAVLKSIDVPVRCVTLDYLAEKDGADSYHLDKLSENCKSHGIPLVINAYGNIGAKHNGAELTKFASAVVYSLEEGSAVNIGKGGLVTTDDPDFFDGAYAYHNCGRSLGVGSTLDMDTIIGGDLRISEWNAVLAEEILKSGELSVVTARELADMKSQPLFEC